MKALIESIFGVYTAVSYVDADSNIIIPAGASGVDWEWIAGVALFALTFYCFMRLLGGVFKK